MDLIFESSDDRYSTFGKYNLHTTDSGAFEIPEEFYDLLSEGGRVVFYSNRFSEAINVNSITGHSEWTKNLLHDLWCCARSGEYTDAFSLIKLISSEFYEVPLDGRTLQLPPKIIEELNEERELILVGAPFGAELLTVDAYQRIEESIDLSVFEKGYEEPAEEVAKRRAAWAETKKNDELTSARARKLGFEQWRNLLEEIRDRVTLIEELAESEELESKFLELKRMAFDAMSRLGDAPSSLDASERALFAYYYTRPLELMYSLYVLDPVTFFAINDSLSREEREYWPFDPLRYCASITNRIADFVRLKGSGAKPVHS